MRCALGYCRHVGDHTPQHDGHADGPDTGEKADETQRNRSEYLEQDIRSGKFRPTAAGNAPGRQPTDYRKVLVCYQLATTETVTSTTEGLTSRNTFAHHTVETGEDASEKGAIDAGEYREPAGGRQVD